MSVSAPMVCKQGRVCLPRAHPGLLHGEDLSDATAAGTEAGQDMGLGGEEGEKALHCPEGGVSFLDVTHSPFEEDEWKVPREKSHWVGWRAFLGTEGVSPARWVI